MTGRGLWPFVLARAACSNSRLNPDDWYPVSVPVAARRQAAAAITVCAACPVRGERLELAPRNSGGPPTPDKPGITVANYEPGDTTSIFLNLRVADIQARYEEWKSKGAEFLTPPIDREAEIRCYMRDPDGYLIEVGQATGILHGIHAKKRPEDLPG
jgi:catechol 2,3-dioxygenase-like lactoylglutathione lyase family enzyme